MDADDRIRIDAEVLRVLQRCSPQGTTVSILMATTGLTQPEVRQALHRLYLAAQLMPGAVVHDPFTGGWARQWVARHNATNGQR